MFNSNYMWFNAVPSGAQLSVKAFVGGQLYRATTTTEKEWQTESNPAWDSPVYENLEARNAIKESVTLGTVVRIPTNTPIKYIYCQS